MTERVSEHQQRKQVLIDIIEGCNFNGRRVYLKSEKAPNTYVGSHAEDATRITMQLSGNNLMVWKGNFKAKTQLIIQIDPDKFKVYTYNIVGLMI
jgi:hypothetical protein